MPLVQTLQYYQLLFGGRTFPPGSVESLSAADYAALVGADKGTKWIDYVPSLGDPIVSSAALPTASAAYRGMLTYVPGNGTSTADQAYVCLMSATGTYSWKSIATG